MKKVILLIITYLYWISFSYSQCDEFKKLIPEWQSQKYNAANTVQNADYLNEEEKKICYFLNLMRLNPPLFAFIFSKNRLYWCFYPSYPSYPSMEKQQHAL